MAIRLYKANTPGTRNRAVSDFSDLSSTKPVKKLVTPLKKNGGRNSRGIITVRHRGGGHKKKYRIIDFKRNKFSVSGIVKTIEYVQPINIYYSLTLVALQVLFIPILLFQRQNFLSKQD